MTVRTRFSLWYVGSVMACTIIILAHAYYEVWLRDHDIPSEQRSQEIVKFTIGLALPMALIGLGGGWWLTRNTLNQLHAITKAASLTKVENLTDVLPRSYNGDEFDRLTGVFNDMRQRLHASFQQIREFTLAASHELKTPLTLMRAGIETAAKNLPATAEAQRTNMEDVVDEIDRLAQIVDRLSFLSKADAGMIQLNEQPVNLSALLADAADDAQTLASTNKIKVSLQSEHNIRIRGDSARLRQMLLNLVDNAVKYNCPEGSLNIHLTKSSTHAVLTVSNTGKGLAEEFHSRVFDRFYRGETSHNSTTEGSGLGLNIVRWIVDSHGGSVTFHSVPNELTTLTIRLPLDLQSNA
jgi:signal transduction histidine kinase